MKTTVEQFRRLLPALHHLARFPSCNWAGICKREGVSLEDIHATVKEACGSVAIWDEDYLVKMAGELGVTVPPYKPSATPRPAPVTTSAKTVTTGGPKLGVLPAKASAAPKPAKVPALVSSETVFKVEKLPPKWPWLKRKWIVGKSFAKYFPILHALAANPAADVPELCIRQKVTRDAFNMFRRDWLCGLELTPMHVELFRRWAAEKLGEKMPAALREPNSGTLADVLPTTAEAGKVTKAAGIARVNPAKAGKSLLAKMAVVTPAADTLSILETLNALIAGYRLEVVSVRLVPAEKSA